MSERQNQKQLTQDRLVAAARDLFSRRSFDRVGIRDVARAVGMSTGAVFASFADKRDLWRAAMGRDPVIRTSAVGLEP